jgi:hypothetical protein
MSVATVAAGRCGHRDRIGLGRLSAAQVQEGGRAFRLPRTFQQAQLGMAMEGITRHYPQARAARLADQELIHSVVVKQKDPYIHHTEYRFYRGTLYEQSIYYKRDRVPHGYAGLVDRLRELYGKPVAEDFNDFDQSADAIFSQKTVWKDDATRVSLAETCKLREGREYYELVLSMTDLALEEAWHQAERERVRQEESRVPVPLPERQKGLDRTAGSTDGRMASGTKG